MKDVFVSYARNESGIVTSLCAELRAHDQSVWVDLDGLYVGDEFWPQICAEIEESSNFCFVVSRASLRSQYCNRELQHAENANKRIIPLVLEDPDADLPPSISRRQWLWFETGDELATSVEKLVTALTRDKDHVDTHTSLLVGARKWIDENRDASFLLRGRALTNAEQWLAHAGAKVPPPSADHLNFLTTSRTASSKRTRLVLSSVIAGLIVALVLAVLAWNQRGLAIQRLHEAVGVGDHIVQVLDRRLSDIPGTSEVRVRLLRSSIDLLDRLEAGARDADVLRRAKAATHVAKGAIEESQGDTEAAIQQLTAAVDLRAQLSREKPGDDERLRSLSIAHERLGELQLRDHRFPEAQKSFTRATQITRALLAANPEDHTLKMDLSYNLIDRGDLAKDLGQLGLAGESYKTAVDLRESLLAADTNSAQALRDLSVALSRVGKIAVLENRLDDAIAVNEREGVIAEQLLKRNPKSARLQRDHGISLDNLGRTAALAERFDVAERAYKQGLEIKKALSSREPTNVIWLRDVSVTYNQLSDLYLRTGQLRPAMQSANEDLRIAYLLVDIDPTGRAFEDLYLSLRQGGNVAADVISKRLLRGEPIDQIVEFGVATDRLRKAIKLGERFLTISNKHLWSRRLGDNYARLGDVSFMRHADTDALEAYQQARANLEAALELKKDKKGWLSLFRVLTDLGLVHQTMNNQRELRRALRDAEEILSRLPLEELVPNRRERMRLERVLEVLKQG